STDLHLSTVSLAPAVLAIVLAVMAVAQGRAWHVVLAATHLQVRPRRGQRSGGITTTRQHPSVSVGGIRASHEPRSQTGNVKALLSEAAVASVPLDVYKTTSGAVGSVRSNSMLAPVSLASTRI